jgi:hypothetical protein
MIAHLWHWAWHDLGTEEPTQRQMILYGVATVALCGVLWGLLTLVLA